MQEHEHVDRKIGDFVLALYHRVGDANHKLMTSKIFRWEVEKWGVSEDQAIQDALENTARLYPASVYDKRTQQEEKFMEKEFTREDITMHLQADMLLLSAMNTPNGAVSIFYPGVIQKMMKIMKDSRLGSFGAIGLILLMLTMWTGYRTIIDEGLLAVLWLMPVVGRYCAIQTCCFSSYAEGGGGLGRRITEITKGWHVAIYLAAIALAAWCIAPILTYAFGITAVLNLIMMADLKRKIGGITGDTIGLTIEITQAVFIVMVLILQHVGIGLPGMV